MSKEDDKTFLDSEAENKIIDTSKQEKIVKDHLKSEKIEDAQRSPSRFASVSRNVQLDVVELLKQVLQWTPLYKPGLNKALIQAAKVGSVGCIKVLISAGADVDTEDENGDTPFVHAMRARHSSCMSLLRDAGCTTEIAKMSVALSAPRDPAFVLLCHSMDVPVENEDWNATDPSEVAILLEQLHLDPFEGQYGRHGFDDSPFMYIVQEGRPEVLEMMVTRHPSIQRYSEDERQSMFDRALFKAIRSRRVDNVKVLVDKLGVKIESRDAQGRTPFILACGHDERSARYLMEQGAQIDAVDSDGLTALHWTSCSGYTSLAATLVEKGKIPLDALANLGATPLMVACAARHLGVAEFLLDAGASVDLSTPDGWRALHVAVRACAPAIVRLLLTNGGADPDSSSSALAQGGDVVPGSTALLIAISLNSVRMLRHLLDAGCDVNRAGLVHVSHSSSAAASSESESEDNKSASASGRQVVLSPLQFAIVSRAWDMVELLVKAGADVSGIIPWLDKSAGLSVPVAVEVPSEQAAFLRRLVTMAATVPGKLRHLARLRVRQLLGRGIGMKIEAMDLPTTAQQYILFYDLFRAHVGSFEV